MPNISLSSRCNLHCPYCFAHETMGAGSGDIRDYANVNDLVAHFMRRIDRPAYRIKAMAECENCHLRRTWLCCQGCMGYKMVEIEKMNAERGE